MSGMEDQQDGMDTDVEYDLINAVKNANESEVRRLINAGADVNQTEGESGKTALFYANKNHNVAVACELIHAGSDFSISEIDAKGVLLNAVRNGKTKVVRRLIHAGIAVDEIDGEGKNALFEAVCCSDETIVHVLVEEGKAFVNARDLNGRTPLFYAITKSTKISTYLIEKGANMKVKDFNNRSVLSFFIEDCMMNEENLPLSSLMSVKSEEFNMLKEPNKQFKHYIKTLLGIVLCKLPLMCVFGRNIPPPMYIVRIWNNFSPALRVVRTYFEEQGNTDKMSSIDSILEIFEDEAFSRKCSELIKILVDLGANVSFADADGNTALHYVTHLPFLGVSKDETMSVLTQLARHGLSLNTRNSQNQTPLLFCLTGSLGNLEEDDKCPAMKTLVDVCTFLVNKGSNIEETTKLGETVFHLIMKLFQEGLQIRDEIARKNVIDETLELLELFSGKVNNRVVVNRPDDCGFNSPLHLWATLAFTASRTVQDYTTSLFGEYTFEKLLEKIQKYLLRCGKISWNSKNKYEETPLHLCNTWSAVKLLIKQGANPDDKDSSKRPPLLVAAMRKTFLVYPSHFYPDVQEDAKSFFKSAVSEMRLDPWTVDNDSKSVLGILIKCETYDLSEALVDVACTLIKEEKEFQKISVFLLNAISRDQSFHIFWKVNLTKTLLTSAKKRKLHVVDEPFNVCCETVRSQWLSGPRKKRSRLEQESVQISIAKLLRENGASLTGDSYAKLKHIAPEIDTIMTKVEVQEMIPWTSVSTTYKNVLERVARRQECKEVNSICFCESPVKSGSFGELFVGINKSDSKEVAIKRLKESSTQLPQEVINRIAHLDCEQVVRYFRHFEVDKSFYIVFELMEGNLDDYLSNSCPEFDSKKTLLCKDVVEGLKYLHQQDIVHGHLKPTNIFFKTHPKLCLKITYFDKSLFADNTSTHSWMSPELLMAGTEEHSKASDTFSCGLLFHYILSKGKHPFSPADTTNTSESEITKANIKVDNMESWDHSLLPEASHLVEKMIASTVKSRPTAEEAIHHPLFWTKEKKIDFLIAVGNQPEFECPRRKRTGLFTAVEKDLESSFGAIVTYKSWKDLKYLHVDRVLSKMTRKNYDTTSVVELVRFIRNVYSHVSELNVQAKILEDFVFLEYFPALVMEVYKAVITHGWDQTRDEIKLAMRK